MTLLAAAGAMLISIPARAATLISLTSAGATSGVTAAEIGGNFVVTQINPQSTGTGVIDPFVRIQKNSVERAYNTSLGLPLDAKSPADGYTRALTLAEIPVVTFNGVQYREFILDINQNAGNDNEFLSLNQIQIFTNSGDMLHTSLADATASTNAIIGFTGASEVFRLSNSALNPTAPAKSYEIRLDAKLNPPGSGVGDMRLLVNNAAFGAAGPNTNVILFSQFGDTPGVYGSNDGFEEWSVLKAGPQVVPEPSTFALGLGALGLLGLAGLRRRRPA